MFRSSTVIRELALNLVKVIYMSLFIMRLFASMLQHAGKQPHNK